jgi:hypothetical protein
MAGPCASDSRKPAPAHQALPRRQDVRLPVSTLVNKPGNDRPECVVPVDGWKLTQPDASSHNDTAIIANLKNANQPDTGSRTVSQRLPRATLPSFLAGQFISVIGTWAQATALPYLAYRISGRPLDLGLIGFSTTLPTLLFALPAGVLIERWDKRKVVIILQAVMSIQALGWRTSPSQAKSRSGISPSWHSYTVQPWQWK